MKKLLFVTTLLLSIFIMTGIANAATLPAGRITAVLEQNDNPIHPRLIDKILFVSGDSVPDEALDSWSVDGNIMAWILPDLYDGHEDGLYDLYIGSNEKIYAPQNCDSYFRNLFVTQLIFENFDTSNVTNMMNMFYGCGGVMYLELPFDVSNVTDMSYMFAYCESLRNVDLNSLNTEKVTSMDHMFLSCSRLENMTISFSANELLDIHGMFEDCRNLETIIFDGFETNKVTNMKELFLNCVNLKEINFGHGFCTSSVTRMGSMFRNCTRLKKLNLNKFDTSNVIEISYMFENCESIKELDLSSFEGSKDRNIRNMFSGCRNLERVNLKNYDMTNVEFVFALFMNCENLKTVELGNFNPILYDDDEGAAEYLFFKCDKLEKIIFYDTVENEDDIRKFWRDDSYISDKELTLYVADAETEALFEANVDYLDMFGADRIKVYNPENPNDEPLFGDINGDGEITIIDVRLLLQMYINL